MTTFIVDDHSGACDSMWSDEFGIETEVSLSKYLFIPSLDAYSDQQSRLIGAPKLLFYCGSFEQIVLHQAQALGILTQDQYELQSENAASYGYDNFGYIELLLEGWEPINYDGVLSRHGVLYGGSGGGHAVIHYQDCYDTKESVVEAIKLDPQSAEPVSHYHYTLDGDDYFQHLAQAGNQVVQNIYLLAEELILSMQSGELGGKMKKVRYSGCTTSSAPEAPPIDVKKVVQGIDKARKKALKNRHKHNKLRFRSDMEISTEKVEFKQIVC